MEFRNKLIVCAVSFLLLGLAAGCKKKVSVTAPPAPPATPVAEVSKPDPPTISVFALDPSLIDPGQTAELRWQVTDATQIEINQGIGSVPPSGHRQIGPNESTTYILTAKGPNGDATAEATLSVAVPLPPLAESFAARPTFGERLSSEVEDAFFDYDRSDLREDARAALIADVLALQSILSDYPTATIVVEGYCDERGSAEYNLALGDSRASAAKEFLGQLGVLNERLMAVSYGKERPQCTESNEACWQKNRRVHFVPGEELKSSALSTPSDNSQAQLLAPMNSPRQ